MAEVTGKSTEEFVTNGTSNQTKESSIPPSPMTKHPLNSSWTLWYFLADKNIAWEDSQIQVASFDTVEDFWSLFNNIQDASQLRMGCDYSLFKTGVKPMWEDESNKKGGKWNLNTSLKSRKQELDSLFTDLVLMMIGENEEASICDEINGVVLNVRHKGDKLALWTRTTNDKELVMSIGELMKRCLNLPDRKLDFIRHADAATSKRGQTLVHMTL